MSYFVKKARRRARRGDDSMQMIGKVRRPYDDNRLLCKPTGENVTHCNTDVFLEDKTQIGKIDDQIAYRNSEGLSKHVSHDYRFLHKFTQMFTVELLDDLEAESFEPGQKVNMRLMFLSFYSFLSIP